MSFWCFIEKLNVFAIHIIKAAKAICETKFLHTSRLLPRSLMKFHCEVTQKIYSRIHLLPFESRSLNEFKQISVVFLSLNIWWEKIILLPTISWYFSISIDYSSTWSLHTIFVFCLVPNTSQWIRPLSRNQLNSLCVRMLQSWNLGSRRKNRQAII